MSKIKRLNPESKAVKRVTWKPGKRLGTVDVPPGYRLRWCENTPQNISKKESDGWEILDKTKFPQLRETNYDQRTTDSNGLTKTTLQRNELIAMIIPEEVAQARNEYYRQETDNLTKQALSPREVKTLLKRIGAGKNVQSLTPVDEVSIID